MPRSFPFAWKAASLSFAQRAGGCKEREKKEEKDIDKREAV